MTIKSDKGCLVIHGLTGSPETMRPVVEALKGAGYLVNAPLLPGHGTALKDLTKVKRDEWRRSVHEAYLDLHREAKKISCIGLSLGSLLTLDLAIQLGWGLRSVVAMGTPLVLTCPIEYLAYPLVRFTPARWFYHYQDKDWTQSVGDPGGRELYKKHSYDKTPIHAVFEIFRLKKEVKSRLFEINVPVCIMHAKKDKVAPFRNVSILDRSLRCNMVDKVFFEKSEHVLTMDYEKDKAADAAVAFVEKFS